MKWEIFDRIYSGHWFLLGYHSRGFVRDFPRLGGGKFISEIAAIMRNGVCTYVLDSDEFNAAANFSSERLINDRRWRKWVYRQVDSYTRYYFSAAENFRQLPFAKLSSTELVQSVGKLLPLQRYHQLYGVLVNGLIIDSRHHLSNKIREELRASIEDSHHFDEYWSLLTLPTRMSLRQKKDYQIALLAKQSPHLSRVEVRHRLQYLHQKYCWLGYLYLGPPTSSEQFEAELAAARRNNENLDLPRRLKFIQTKQADLIQRLKLGNRARFLVKLAQETIEQKGLRKDVMSHGFYCYEPFWRELARRKRINDWQIMTFLFPWEVESFILRNTLSTSELIARREHSCFIVKGRTMKLMLGVQALNFYTRLKVSTRLVGVSETSGQCAYVGKTRGLVKIIQIPADMKKMKKGDILMSQATSPDLLPAMVKAGAMVTNKGGLISHAAIIARELRIPCVVGTNNATLIFKDGDMVEVDATRGIIRKVHPRG